MRYVEFSKDAYTQRSIDTIAIRIIYHYGDDAKKAFQRKGYIEVSDLKSRYLKDFSKFSEHTNLPEFFQKFLMERAYTLKIVWDFSDYGFNDSRASYYNGDNFEEIILRNKDFIRLTVDFLKDGNDFKEMKITTETQRNFWRMVNGFSEDVKHELTHAYDDWQSNGKYRLGRKRNVFRRAYDRAEKDPSEENKIRKTIAYINQPHEMNAFFRSAVAAIPEPSNLSWNEYRNDFLDTIAFKLEYLPEKFQRRLLSRLATYWMHAQDMKKDQS